MRPIFLGGLRIYGNPLLGDVKPRVKLPNSRALRPPEHSVPPMDDGMALLQQGADCSLVFGEVACDHAQFERAEDAGVRLAF